MKLKKDIELNKNIYNAHYQEKEIYYEPYLEVIEHIFMKEGYSSLLDFGCGNGKLGKYLRDNNHHISIDGIDISETAIEKAKKYYNNVYIRHDYKLPDKKYDFIILNSVIEHIYEENLAILFEDIKKKATGNASLFVTVPNIHSPHYLFFDNLEKEKKEAGHVTMKSKKAWLDFFRSWGFNTFRFSFFIKLKHLDRIMYFKNLPLLHRIVKLCYNLLLISPFNRLKVSFYIHIKK
ncbi:class I SAM-dependent methyltransferase [Spirochaetota bacterium]